MHGWKCHPVAVLITRAPSTHHMRMHQWLYACQFFACRKAVLRLFWHKACKVWWVKMICLVGCSICNPCCNCFCVWVSAMMKGSWQETALLTCRRQWWIMFYLASSTAGDASQCIPVPA